MGRRSCSATHRLAIQAESGDRDGAVQESGARSDTPESTHSKSIYLIRTIESFRSRKQSNCRKSRSRRRSHPVVLTVCKNASFMPSPSRRSPLLPITPSKTWERDRYQKSGSVNEETLCALRGESLELRLFIDNLNFVEYGVSLSILNLGLRGISGANLPGYGDKPVGWAGCISRMRLSDLRKQRNDTRNRKARTSTYGRRLDFPRVGSGEPG